MYKQIASFDVNEYYSSGAQMMTIRTSALSDSLSYNHAMIITKCLPNIFELAHTCAMLARDARDASAQARDATYEICSTRITREILGLGIDQPSDVDASVMLRIPASHLLPLVCVIVREHQVNILAFLLRALGVRVLVVNSRESLATFDAMAQRYDVIVTISNTTKQSLRLRIPTNIKAKKLMFPGALDHSLGTRAFAYAITVDSRCGTSVVNITMTARVTVSTRVNGPAPWFGIDYDMEMFMLISCVAHSLHGADSWMHIANSEMVKLHEIEHGTHQHALLRSGRDKIARADAIVSAFLCACELASSRACASLYIYSGEMHYDTFCERAQRIATLWNVDMYTTATYAQACTAKGAFVYVMDGTKSPVVGRNYCAIIATNATHATQVVRTLRKIGAAPADDHIHVCV